MNLFHLLQMLIKVMGSDATGIMRKALEGTRDGERVTGPSGELAHFSIFDG